MAEASGFELLAAYVSLKTSGLSRAMAQVTRLENHVRQSMGRIQAAIRQGLAIPNVQIPTSRAAVDLVGASRRATSAAARAARRSVPENDVELSDEIEKERDLRRRKSLLRRRRKATRRRNQREEQQADRLARDLEISDARFQAKLLAARKKRRKAQERRQERWDRENARETQRLDTRRQKLARLQRKRRKAQQRRQERWDRQLARDQANQQRYDDKLNRARRRRRKAQQRRAQRQARTAETERLGRIRTSGRAAQGALFGLSSFSSLFSGLSGLSAGLLRLGFLAGALGELAAKAEQASQKMPKLKNALDAMKKVASTVGLSIIAAARAVVTFGAANPVAAGLVLGLTAAMTSFVVGATAFTVAILRVTRLIRDSYGELEQMTFIFASLIGSQGAAQNTISGIRNLAADTTLEFDKLAAAARSLLVAIPSDQVEDRLRRLGDVAAGTGSDIVQLSRNFAKAAQRGRVTQEVLELFQFQNVPIVRALSEELGITQQQVAEQVRRGLITFKELEAAFITMTNEGGQFFGLQAKLSTTLIGFATRMRDIFTQIRESFGQILNALFVPIRAFLAGGIRVFSGLRVRLQAIAQALQPLVDKIVPLVVAFGERLGEFFDVLVTGPALSLLESMLSVATVLLGVLGRAFQMGVKVGETLNSFFKSLSTLITPLEGSILRIGNAAALANAFMTNLPEALKIAATAIVHLAVLLGQRLKEVLNPADIIFNELQRRIGTDTANILGAQLNAMLDEFRIKMDESTRDFTEGGVGALGQARDTILSLEEFRRKLEFSDSGQIDFQRQALKDNKTIIDELRAGNDIARERRDKIQADFAAAAGREEFQAVPVVGE